MVDRLIEQERRMEYMALEEETKNLGVPIIDSLNLVLKDNSPVFAYNRPKYEEIVAVSPIYLNQEKYPEQIRIWSNKEWLAYSRKTERTVETMLELFHIPPVGKEIEQMFDLFYLLRKEPKLDKYLNPCRKIIFSYSDNYVLLLNSKIFLSHKRSQLAYEGLNKILDAAPSKPVPFKRRWIIL